MGLEPVRSSQSFADRFRSIHMVLFDRKRNFSGPPLGGLAKNKSKLDHFKWFDVCPDATLESAHPRSIRFSRCTPCGSSGSTGPRGKEIYCQTGGAPGGGNLGAHISYTYKGSRLAGNYKRGPRIRDPLLRLSMEIGFQTLRPTACDQIPRWNQAPHPPQLHPRP